MGEAAYSLRGLFALLVCDIQMDGFWDGVAMELLIGFFLMGRVMLYLSFI